MAKRYVEDRVIMDARIFSKNFAGREVVKNGKIVNAEGKMTFCLSISDDIAQEMIEEGWDIHISAPREDVEGSTASYYLPVEVKYKDRYGKDVPNFIYPHIYMYLGKPGRNERELDDESIAVLDGAMFEKIDMTIHAKNYDDDKTGEEKIKAYLLDGRFTIKESRLAAMYSKYNEEYEVPFD